jgi:hypothetical protein
MKRKIQIQLNEGDLEGSSSGDVVNVTRYCSVVQELLPDYEIKWNIEYRESGVSAPPSFIDGKDYSAQELDDMILAVAYAEENAFSDDRIWDYISHEV